MRRASALVMAWCLASPALAQETRSGSAPASVPNLQVTSAIASQPDLCIGIESYAMGTVMVGVTVNAVKVDKTCARLRRARALDQMGYRPAAVQLLCDDPEVREAMRRASTPCDDQRAR